VTFGNTNKDGVFVPSRGYGEILGEKDAEIGRLRTALEPFAKAALFFAAHRDTMKPDQVLVQHETIGAQAIITLADLNRALSALGQFRESETK
jgi:hypothetical protein